jgi:hypothetical protein
MPERPETIEDSIALLSHPDGQQREHGARELFRVGCATAEPALRVWFSDPDFRALVRTGPRLLTVGVAVEPRRFEQIRAACGVPPLAEAPADQDVLEFELEFAHGVQLDVLTTRDAMGDGAIARFLSRFGEGVQQVECTVLDVSRATEILRTKFNLEPVYPDARAGADGTRINFFLVKVADDKKVLVELVEVPARKARK